MAKRRGLILVFLSLMMAVEARMPSASGRSLVRTALDRMAARFPPAACAQITFADDQWNAVEPGDGVAFLALSHRRAAKFELEQFGRQRRRNS
jgi:hypothetical protein